MQVTDVIINYIITVTLGTIITEITLFIVLIVFTINYHTVIIMLLLLPL